MAEVNGNGGRNGLGPLGSIVTLIVSTIKDVGFPIAVTAYLLYRMDDLVVKGIDAQVQIINTQVEIIRQLGILVDLIRALAK